MIRNKEIKQFLKLHGWQNAKSEEITSDASNRKYSRLFKEKNTLVLMDSNPTENESIQDFIYYTNELRSHDFSAPKIYGSDVNNGFLLLEDLGKNNFASMLKNQPNLENTIYREAINQLIEIQNTTIPTFTLPYDFKVLVKEVLLFADWYLSALQIPQKSKNLLDILNPLFEKVLKQKPTLVLRDYHAENLIWLPKRNKNKRIGLLDYQDALAGHPAYDLASLLKDARRDVSFKLRDELTDYFLKQTKFDRELFLRDYSILSAQRNLKIIGIFIIFSLMFIGSLTMTGTLTPTMVLEGNDLSEDYREALIKSDIIYQGDNIQYFYSDGFSRIEETGSILTSDRVIMYFEDENKDTGVYELYFEDITDVELIEAGNVLNDSVYRVYGDSREVYLTIVLSRENKGDVKFIEALRSGLKP